MTASHPTTSSFDFSSLERDPIARTSDHPWGRGRRSAAHRYVLPVRLLILLVAAGAAFLVMTGPVEAEAPLVTSEHVVTSGETLWQLAGSITPAGDDVRSTVEWIIELNGLGSSGIYPGQRLVLPAG